MEDKFDLLSDDQWEIIIAEDEQQNYSSCEGVEINEVPGHGVMEDEPYDVNSDELVYNFMEES